MRIGSLPTPPRKARFALPPSLGAEAAGGRATQLAQFLSEALSEELEVRVSDSYEGMAKDILAGRVDAAWAPPYVCARVEAMGVRIAVRGVRRGASSYRAALLKRVGSPHSMDALAGARIAWVDQDSVAGHLLPMSTLKARGLDPRALGGQAFVGSYRAALEAVLGGEADVASIFCGLEQGRGTWQDSVELVAPGRSAQLESLGFTDESPNDGVAVSMGSTPALVQRVEQAFLELHQDDGGRALLEEIFNAERFEPAPRLGYRALYRVSLSAI